MKKNTLDPDGERMVPEFHKGELIYGEHLSRYSSIIDICNDKVVLDIASGSGYGTKMISQVANKVYGVDISDEAIAYAKDNYAAKNITYKVGDGTKIPLEDNSVDIVVSMETIEHIEDQESHLAEIVRVLKVDGIYICSTPNDRVYPKGNHYHVREHSSKSLRKLLSIYFKHTHFYFQTIDYVASIFSEEDLGDEFSEDRRLIKTIKTDPEESIYFLVICSNANNITPIKSSHTISKMYSYPEQVKLNTRLAHADLNEKRIKFMESDIVRIKKDLDFEKKLINEELQSIKSSKKYKIAKVIALPAAALRKIIKK